MMSLFSRVPSAGTSPAAEPSAPKGISQPGRYFTDGANLYRHLGEIADGTGPMIGLEDCRSLDVILVPTCDLRAYGLRVVRSGVRR